MVVAATINMGEGAWFGLDILVICASIGLDVFVQPDPVIIENPENNLIAGGKPVERLSLKYKTHP